MDFGNGGDAADQQPGICGPCKQKAGARPPPRKRPQEAAQLCGLEPTTKVCWKAGIACVQQGFCTDQVASSWLGFRRAQQSTNGFELEGHEDDHLDFSARGTLQLGIPTLL